MIFHYITVYDSIVYDIIYAVKLIPVPVKKRSSGEENPYGHKLAQHQIRRRIGQRLAHKECLSQTPVPMPRPRATVLQTSYRTRQAACQTMLGLRIPFWGNQPP